jgi:hypothetical protein
MGQELGNALMHLRKPSRRQRVSEIYELLCTKDHRNPMYLDIYGEDDEAPVPRKGCACDNCFFGRDKLALEIISSRERIKVLDAVKDAAEKLANRHDWQPDMGQCHCSEHMVIREALQAAKGDGG